MGSHRYVKADLSVLMSDTAESYYWMGFVAADATINHDAKRLKVHLGKKDQKHLRAFARYISYQNAVKPYIAVQDKYMVARLAAKFDLKPRKTYNPPDITWMRNDLFVAFVIGFVDGDGNVQHQTGRQDCRIRIKVHSSWLGNLQYISDFVSRAVDQRAVRAKINKAGYAELEIANGIVVKYLKVRAVVLELPYLERKWKKIREDKLTKGELAARRREQVFSLYEEGTKGTEIASLVGISNGRVSTLLKSYKDFNRRRDNE